jgi:acetamidase/formamidase
MEPGEIDQSGVVPPTAVPQYVRDIYREVKDRGPGPHVLTGPVFVTGAMPGDVLQVRILEIDLAVDYGYNRQRPYNGALPEEFPGFFQRIFPINRQAKTGGSADPAVLRDHGRRAPSRHGPDRLGTAGHPHRQDRQQDAAAGACCTCRLHTGRVVLGG